MALKITAQIGTDQGITSEAYVRISTYQINKTGSAYFGLQLFQSQSDVPAASADGPSVMVSGSARNAQIGDTLIVPMKKTISVTTTEKRMVPEEKQITEEIIVPPAEEGGEPTTNTVTRTVTELVEKDVEVTTDKVVPDLSAAEDVDIFEFAYGKLKEKLAELFGAENVVDC